MDAFCRTGGFTSFLNVKKLESLFRHKVFKMLLKEKKISRELVDKLLSWKNSGFNITIKSRSKVTTVMDGRA